MSEVEPRKLPQVPHVLLSNPPQLSHAGADTVTASKVLSNDAAPADTPVATGNVTRSALPPEVVTEIKPTATATVTTKPKYHHDHETIAANRLALAESALAAGGPEQARKLVLDILTEFPETRAAVKARELLAKLPSAKR